ncbi:MAG: GntR family transcriptional regulator [Oscillochloris sp.]|nr:GntR family transcriptional regulator [Oscillochloris sp.]
MSVHRSLLSFALPIYAQIRDHLREQIEAQTIPPNGPLPSERALCNEYQVSRGPVRQALRELEQEGLIYRRDRVGYFAAPPQVAYQLHQPISFTEEIGLQGRRPGAQVLHQSIEAPSRRVREALRMSIGDPVLHIRRLRSADAQPLMIETLFLDGKRFAALAQRDLNDQSIWQLLRGEYGVQVGGSSFQIQMTRLSAEIAERLAVQEHDPGFSVVRLVHEADGRPLELIFELYRADQAVFRMTTQPGFLDQRLDSTLDALMSEDL